MKNRKIFLTLILTILLCLTTKTIAQPPPSPAPEISVTDSVTPVDDLQIVFGGVTEDSLSAQTVTLKNYGNAGLEIGDIAQTDSLIAPFDILNDSCSGQTIIPSEECTFRVSFSPSDTGLFNESFDIPSNDSDENPVTITLSGTGLSSAANNPPSIPQFLYPANGQSDLGTTLEFRWEKSADPDGDTVTYDLYICEDENLAAGCFTEEDIAFLGNKRIYYAVIGGYETGLLLFGIAIVRTGSVKGRKNLLKNGEKGKQRLNKRRKTGFLMVIIAISGMLLVSCGGSGTSSNGNTDTSNEISYTVSGLSPDTTYYWKVIAKDDNGEETESSVWSFTTAS